MRLYRATLNTFRGFAWAARNERAMRDEIVLLAASLPLGLLLAPSIAWFVAMVGAIWVIMAVELLNTAVEKLADHVTPEWHSQIETIKDCGSAAVFCTLCLAGLIWIAALAVKFAIV